MIETRLLVSDRNLPLLVEQKRSDGAASDTDSLVPWLRDNKHEIADKLLQFGAILFRGFGVDTPAAFARLARAVEPRLLDGKQDANRAKLAPGIYTSTEYPAEYTMSLHSEFSYSNQWPAKLIFCCVVAAREGGETPIADSREVLRRLNPEVVDEFRRKRVTYVRNFHDGRGFRSSWQVAFGTSDKGVIESHCREANVDFAWTEGGLTLRETQDSTTRHPKTGEEVWFNQALQFHPSDYPQDLYRALISAYKDESELPQNVHFGDGTPIDPAMLAHVRQTMHESAVRFPWEAGDVLMIDNVLVAHGRMPFVGPRKILLAMSAD